MSDFLTQYTSQISQELTEIKIPRLRPEHVELSYSGMGALSSCPRKLWLNKNMYSTYSLSDDSPASICGKSYHVFAQELLSTGNLDAAIYAAFRKYDFSILEGASAYDIKHRSFWNMIAAAIKTKDSLFRSDVTIATLPISTPKPAIETAFNIILTHPDWAKQYHYRGYIDIILHQTHTNHYFPVDLKTKPNKPSETTKAEYHSSTQLVPYAMATSSLFSQPITNHNPMKAEFLIQYMDTLEPELVSHPAPVTQDDIDAWLIHMLDNITLLERYEARGLWPKSTRTCLAWNRPCKYLSVCDLTDNNIIQDKILGRRQPVDPPELSPDITIRIPCEELPYV